ATIRSTPVTSHEDSAETSRAGRVPLSVSAIAQPTRSEPQVFIVSPPSRSGWRPARTVSSPARLIVGEGITQRNLVGERGPHRQSYWRPRDPPPPADDGGAAYPRGS